MIKKSILDIVIGIIVFISLFLGLVGIGYIQDIYNQIPRSDIIPTTDIRVYTQAHDRINYISSKTYHHQHRNHMRSCSTECICSKAGLLPYGRYCGWGYYTCESDIKPCDPLDYCCSIHDECVTKHTELDCGCHVSLLRCATCVYANELYPVAPRKGWICNHTIDAIENIVSEIKFLFPTCFSN